MEKQKHDTDNNSGENFTEGEEGTGARWSVPDRGARAPRGAAQAASCAAHPCSPRVPTTHITPLSGAESPPRTPVHTGKHRPASPREPTPPPTRRLPPPARERTCIISIESFWRASASAASASASAPAAPPAPVAPTLCAAPRWETRGPGAEVAREIDTLNEKQDCVERCSKC